MFTRLVNRFLSMVTDEVAGVDDNIGPQGCNPREDIRHIVISYTFPDRNIAEMDQGLAGERRGQTTNGKIALHEFDPCRFDPPSVESGQDGDSSGGF